jgi:hypothetical protein
MWTLLLADLKYTRIGLSIIALLSAYFFFQHAWVSGWHFYAFVHNSCASALITMGIMAASIDKEKRDRTHMVLPVTVRSVGLARLLYVPVVFVGLIVVWTIYLLVRPQAPTISDVWFMLNATAVSFFVFMFFALHHDYSYYGTKRYRLWLYVPLLVLVATVVLVGFTQELDEIIPTYWAFLGSFAAVAVHFPIAGLLLLLGVRAFERRRSFLS